MEKLNLKTDGLMLVVYIKKLMKFRILFRASTAKIENGTYQFRHILTEQCPTVC